MKLKVVYFPHMLIKVSVSHIHVRTHIQVHVHVYICSFQLHVHVCITVIERQKPILYERNASSLPTGDLNRERVKERLSSVTMFPKVVMYMYVVYMIQLFY